MFLAFQFAFQSWIRKRQVAGEIHSLAWIPQSKKRIGAKDDNKIRNLSIDSSSNVINVDQSFESFSAAESFVGGRTKNNRGGYHVKHDRSNRDRRPSVQPRIYSSRGGRRVREARPRFVKSEGEDDTTCRGPKEVAMKNAVMMLNEMFPPPGAPQYKVVSNYPGQPYLVKAK